MFINAFIAWIYFGQLQEMVGAVEQTNDLSRNYRYQNLQLAKQASETHDLAIASGKQANALTNTLSLERPWVGIRGSQETTNTAGDVVYSVVTITNGGRTTATHVSANLVFMTGAPLPKFGDPRILPRNPKCGKAINRDGGILIPNTPRQDLIEVPNTIKMRSVTINDMKVGLYLVGCIDYSGPSEREQFRTQVTEKYIPGAHILSTTRMGNASIDMSAERAKSEDH